MTSKRHDSASRRQISPFGPLAAIVFAFSFTSVATADAQGRAQPPRDSGGVRIIRYSAPSANTTMLSAAPILSVSEAPECLFGALDGLLLTSQGRYIAVDKRGSQLCLFSADGRFVRQIGRAGAGPGEFRELGYVELLRGDTLAVYDGSLLRLSLYNPAGDFVRTAAIVLPADSLQPFPSTMLGLRDGTILLGFPHPRPSTQGRQVFNQEMFRFDSRGSVLGSIGSLPIGEHLIVPVLTERPNQVPMLGYYSAALGSTGLAASAPTGFVTNNGAGFDVREHSFAGRVSTIHRLDLPLTPVDAAMIARYKERAISAATTPRARGINDYLIGLMTYPRTLPTFTKMLVDPRGRIWLRRWTESGRDAASSWIVLDPSPGRALQFDAPAGLDLVAIGAAAACGVLRDADGLGTVRCYRVME